MKKWVIVVLVVLVIALIAWFVHRKKKSSKRKISGLSFPPVSGKPGSMWREQVASAAPGLAKKVRSLGSGDHFPSAVPTISPTTTPPFTLGPVPNGLTRTPEPPTLQPANAAELVGADATLYDLPAGARATSIGGVQVKPVQNPWDTKSWEFLVGVDVKTALEIVNNLFPSFPISARSASDPPSMSGALTLKFDQAGKVVAVVRD
jgi:hypothetical protein